MTQVKSTFILHLETSTKVCSVAISKNGEAICVEEISDESYAHGEMLTILIQSCLDKSKLTIKDMNAVCVASGPGSYTGLRIGVATAKGICYSLKIPLITVDSLTSLIAIARKKNPNSNLCALIDARRMEVFSKIENSNGDTLKEISADIIESNSYQKYEPFVFFGDGAEKLKVIWSTPNTSFDTTLSSAIGQCKIAYDKFQNSEFEDVAYFEPFYLKDFIAGTPKKINL